LVRESDVKPSHSKMRAPTTDRHIQSHPGTEYSVGQTAKSAGICVISTQL
jgi:hypothetical protein